LSEKGGEKYNYSSPTNTPYAILLSMESSPSFIDVRGLGVAYAPPAAGWRRLVGQPTAPQQVLHDVTFSLQQGDQVTLFGAEGAGKSTLLRALTGVVVPATGRVLVNGAPAQHNKQLAAGYVSSEESEPRVETVGAILDAFGKAHNLKNMPARLGMVSEAAGLTHLLNRLAQTLSTLERLRLNLARAALSDAPVLLFDDVADHLGVPAFSAFRETLFAGRTLIIATRNPAVAQDLQLPLLLLHDGTLAHYGTCDSIAADVACPRVVDAWIEGLRYDVFRKLRQHPGVAQVRLLPSSRFAGQRLRIHVRSARYLPSVYDAISQATLVKVKEIPPSLIEILRTLNE
jgi:iron complex transport system ATP-binding protein